MKYSVRVLPRAKRQARQITEWIAERSPDGAERWLVAYEQMLHRLETQADGCGLAPEDEFVTWKIQHAHFKTRKGRSYRALFTIHGGEVRILAVRGPGQNLVEPFELNEAGG